MDCCTLVLSGVDLCMFALSEMGFGAVELNLSAAFNISVLKIKAKTVKVILNLSKLGSL